MFPPILSEQSEDYVIETCTLWNNDNLWTSCLIDTKVGPRVSKGWSDLILKTVR